MTNNGRLAQKWKNFPVGFNWGSGGSEWLIQISNWKSSILNQNEELGVPLTEWI